jgi:hypothetical protein
MWANVFIGFFWTIKTISLAMSGSVRFLAYFLVGGLVGVGIIHFVLAATFDSSMRPIFWSIWNFTFVGLIALLAGAIVSVVKFGERSEQARIRRDDEGRNEPFNQ